MTQPTTIRSLVFRRAARIAALLRALAGDTPPAEEPAASPEELATPPPELAAALPASAQGAPPAAEELVAAPPAWPGDTPPAEVSALPFAARRSACRRCQGGRCELSAI